MYTLDVFTSNMYTSDALPLHFISNAYTSTMYTSSSDVDITRSYFWLVYHHAPGQISFPISLGKSSLFHVVINPHINLFILIFREGFTSRVFGVWGSHLISVSSSCYFEKVSLVFGVWCLVFGVWGLVFDVWCLMFGVWGLVFEAVQLSPLISDQSLTSLVSDSFQTIGHFDFRLVSDLSDLFQSLTLILDNWLH